jgi:flagellar hook-associated protein 3 FlgL
MSKNEDADIAEVIMNLQNEENVYRASLSAGARVIQPSLVDFLK